MLAPVRPSPIDSATRLSTLREIAYGNFLPIQIPLQTIKQKPHPNHEGSDKVLVGGERGI